MTKKKKKNLGQHRLILKVILKNIRPSVAVQLLFLIVRPLLGNREIDLHDIFSSLCDVFKTFMHKEPHTSNLNYFLLIEQKEVEEILQSLVAFPFILQTHVATLKDGIK